MVVAFTFPKPVLSPVVPAGTSKPSYTTLKVLQTEVNENALSAKTRFAGGNFGFLGLTVSEAVLVKLTNNVVYVPPVEPPDTPPHAVGATQPQITETNRQYLQDIKEYDTYSSMSKALVAMVVQAVPDDFISELKCPVMGYGNVTVLTLLTHLWVCYGQIEPAELIMNRKRMAAPWLFPAPIERLYGQLRDGMQFANEGGDPVSEFAAVLDGEINIEGNPLFSTASEEWRKKAPADKTMAAFKEHFSRKDSDLRRPLLRAITSGTTTGEAGYHSANQVYETTPCEEVTVSPTAAAANVVVPSTLPARATGPTYYHYHGIMLKGGHTSATCKNRNEPGHQVKATLHNKMNGNTETFVPYYKRVPRTEE